MIVADTNLVAYLLIDGEKTEAARRVWARDPDWRMPPLWRSELLNVLATTVRAGVLEPTQAHATWRIASGLFGRGEVEPTGADVLTLAMERGISAYDAHFVAVARDLGIRLVTGDRKLLAACPDESVGIEQFGAGA